jgi:glc operon protein GlcG
MPRKSYRSGVALTVLAIALLASNAAAQERPAYGPPITLEQAKQVMAAAEQEARRNDWNVVITIVDPGGNLVMMQRLDETQIGSIAVAEQKAYSAAAFRRSTKAFEDALAGPGGARLLSIPGAMPIEGGLPIVVDGRIVGAIGVSGVTAEQDGIIAAAGVNAVN